VANLPLTPNHGTALASAARRRLPRYLALAYVVLIAYASLHPFVGWRDPGLSPFVFLDAEWPRYWTSFDVGINIVAYIPLGFLSTQGIGRLRPRVLAPLLALVAGTALSFSIESIQTWLPSRVPSNVDFAFNTLGNAVGVVLSLWFGKQVFSAMARWQERFLTPMPHIEAAMVLVGLWLLTQLSPETMLFGSGDLRLLLDISPFISFAPPAFFATEATVVVCNTITMGLIVRSLVTRRHAAYLATPVIIGLALSIRTLAAAVLIDPENAFAWFTPGAALGLMVGGGLLCAMLLLPARWRALFGAISLIVGMLLVNSAPFNPYSLAALAMWRQGHFLNFNGLTRLSASFWPFLALAYLVAVWHWRRHGRAVGPLDAPSTQDIAS
jgi:VanZ family protein